MASLIKPKSLQEGDTVATISLSWGGAGELLHRYETGKKRLQDNFGLKVVETKNALKSAEYIEKNPETPVLAAVASGIVVWAILWYFQKQSTVTYSKVFETDELTSTNQFIA